MMKYVIVILANSVSCVHGMEVEKIDPNDEDTALVQTFHHVEKQEVPAVVDEQGNEIPSTVQIQDTILLAGQTSSAGDSAAHASQGSIEVRSEQRPVLAPNGSVSLPSQLTHRSSPVHGHGAPAAQIKFPDSPPAQKFSWYEKIMNAICCKRRK